MRCAARSTPGSETLSPFQYLVLAYALIWASLAVYLFSLNRRIARVRGEVDELRRRLGDENTDA